MWASECAHAAHTSSLGRARVMWPALAPIYRRLHVLSALLIYAPRLVPWGNSTHSLTIYAHRVRPPPPSTASQEPSIYLYLKWYFSLLEQWASGVGGVIQRLITLVLPFLFLGSISEEQQNWLRASWIPPFYSTYNWRSGNEWPRPLWRPVNKKEVLQAGGCCSDWLRSSSR